MPGNARPRKRYRPRVVDMDPVETVIARAGKLQGAQRSMLHGPLAQAFDGLRDGTGGWPAWCTLADGMNVAEKLAQAGIASDRVPEIREAQAALAAVHHRHQQGGSWTLRASEMAALDFGLLLHQVQLDHCSQGEMAAAISTVMRCVQQALAGNAPRDAMVCVGQLGTAAP